MPVTWQRTNPLTWQLSKMKSSANRQLSKHQVTADSVNLPKNSNLFRCFCPEPATLLLKKGAQATLHNKTWDVYG